MRTNRDSGSDFEQRLLDELKAVIAERGAEGADPSETVAPRLARRRAQRLALAAVAVIAAAAAVLAFSSGGGSTPRAFAIEPQAGGGVTVRVFSLEDARGLERALEHAGIRAQVTWLAAGMTCREPHYRPSVVHLPGGGTLGGIQMGGPEAMTFGVGSTRSWRERVGKHIRGEISDREFERSTPNLNLDPEAFRPDQSVVISGAPGPYDGDPEGGYEAKLAIAAGPVERCQPVDSGGKGILRDMAAASASE
ncbi:MAG TPA: hypothetical protein VFJ99_07155 [Solirubrobacterales bacterium]|nr:hypothetical protein [Solirubrobacterales bacterium]